jgi:hypothetical protein
MLSNFATEANFPHAETIEIAMEHEQGIAIKHKDPHRRTIGASGDSELRWARADNGARDEERASRHPHHD